MLRYAKVLGSLIAGLLLTAAGAMSAEAPKEMKLYVFTLGRAEPRQVDYSERCQRQGHRSRSAST